MFKTLVKEEVIVELKNDVMIKGKLHSVDQYLNVKICDIDPSFDKTHSAPYLTCVKNCFIRGSSIRYIHLPATKVDAPVLADATRRELVQHMN